MRRFAAAALLIAGVVGGFWLHRQPRPLPLVPDARLDAPAVVQAGDSLDVVVEAAAPEGTPVLVLFTSGYRTTVAEGLMRGHTLSVRAPSGVTDAAGRLQVSARVGWSWARASVQVLPGPVAEPPVPLAGARSVFAGDSDRSMVVVVASDALGNPTPAKATITAQWPDGHRQLVETHPSSTLQWAWIPARLVAGSILVTASAGGIPGPDREVRVVPSEPRRLDFEVARTVLRADGASLIELTTSSLTDRYGNLLLDGTAVMVRTVSPDGSRSFQTVHTVNGVARAILQAPSRPGALEIVVSAGSATARRTIAVSAAVATSVPPTEIEAGAGPDRVTVGPVLGDLGQLVPDGTPVGIVTDSGEALEGVTRAGMAWFSLELSSVGSIAVKVGGRGFEISVGSGA